MSSSPRLEQVDAFESVYGDDRISRRLSDQAGQFGKGSTGSAAINDGANGERHNINLENRRRSIKEVADRISELLKSGEYESCYLAASNEINNQIMENLSPEARGKIEKNVHRNLVNAAREEVLHHFV